MGELDHVFVYENIILVCEDTTSAHPRDHLVNKKVLFDEIAANRSEFLKWLRTDFPEQLDSVEEYDAARYKIFFLYFTSIDYILDPDDVKLFSPVKVVRPSTQAYFAKMAANIRRSARMDVFRFLEIETEDLGAPDSSSAGKRIPTTIIYPTDNTGLRDGIRVVSFMMSADALLRNCYVLRKDNWEDSIALYQRLIERDRIQGIRRYLAAKQSTFLNNIIVSLPEGVEFRDTSSNAIELGEVSSFQNVQMTLPDEMNSICVIDGQHRIFAHYEGVDVLEPKIRKLRSKFHLLVTGLIYPPHMAALERRKFESELFLDINSNARPVPPDVLLFIETLKDPFSDLGVARQVLDGLNKRQPFANRFQMSVVDEGKVKIASIIKFALRYLVEITSDASRATLFNHWSTPEDRQALLKAKEDGSDATLLGPYVDFVVTTLSTYFSALKISVGGLWDVEGSKILSTVSINGFIIALRRSLPSLGVMDFERYQSASGKLHVDYGRASFPFASSQYVKFSRVILDQAFELQEVE